MPAPAPIVDLAIEQLSVVLPAAVGTDWQPPARLRLVPARDFRARDGRPEEVAAWRMNAALAAGCIAHQRSQSDDFVIDYEHQTLRSVDNGHPAPAAGWWSGAKVEWVDGAEPGLYATDLRWTDRASAMLRANEYRYFSPVIAWDQRTGDVRAVLLGALTNRAAVDGLNNLSAAALSVLGGRLSLPTLPETPMDPIVLRKALALPDTATDQEVLDKIGALLKAAAEATAACAALTTETAALKARTAPDLNGYIPLAVHAETVAALRALATGSAAGELDRLITDALADGRIPGQATADYLRGKGLDFAKTYLADAPALAALSRTQTRQGERRANEPIDTLDAADRKVAADLGLTPDAYLAAKKDGAQ